MKSNNNSGFPWFRASVLRHQVPRQDCHVHSTFSDGKATWSAMVEQAAKISLEKITFTEHVNQSSTWVPGYVQTIRNAQKERSFNVDIFLSGEVKAADVDGTPDINPEYLSQFDYLVGVIHRYPKIGGGLHNFKDLTQEQAQDIDFSVSRRLILHPNVHVLGHLGGTFSHYFGEYAVGLLEELVDLAAAHGKVIELNSNDRYRHQFDRILRRCLATDCLITLGSDAHTLDELGGCIGRVEKKMADLPQKGIYGNPKG